LTPFDKWHWLVIEGALILLLVAYLLRPWLV
jgi:hypothetical protein